MTDNANNEIPEISEITPLPTPPVGMPRVPVTLFNVWTWSTPVIPEFYWNVYSSEQRIKAICKEIGKIESYLNYAAATANEAHLDMENHINEVQEKLSKAIADLTQRLTTEVNRLDALITAETAAREAGDERLEAEITKETTERKAGDAKLTADLEKEVKDRQDADENLHTEVSTETTARIHADDALHAEISAEKTAREEADANANAAITQEVADRKAADDALSKRIDANNTEISKIDASLATKLEKTDLKASGKITITPGDGNTLTIGDTFEADFAALQTAIAGLQASLASETDERRADDSKLWTAVNNRIERGKILAGAGISVVNDPDSTTVTISATGASDLTAIEAKAEAAKNTADAAQATATGAESKAEQALTAAQGSLKAVAHTASLSGNGTTATPLALTPATATTLGGVKVGSGLAVTSDGTLSTTAQGGTGGIAEVAHDETLAGNGSSSSPLAVNYGSGLAVSGGKLTAEVTQAELTAVDGKATDASTAAQEAKTTAQEAKTAAQGSLKAVAVGTGLKGNGTAESPLAAKLGLGLESSSQGQIQLKTDASFYTSSGKLEMAPATATVRGGVKVGAGLKVTSDGTLSATTTGLTKVAHGSTLNGDGTSGHPLEVRTASESEAGVLTEARVRELGASGLTEVAHDESLEGEGTEGQPLRVAPGTKERIGGVKEASDGSITIWDDGGLIPRKITETTESAEEFGMVNQNGIKRVASTIFDEKRGIETGREAGVCAKVSWDVFGFNENGEIALCDRNLATGKSEENLPSSYFTRAGEPAFLQTVGMGDDKTCFYFFNANFEVKEKGSSAWEAAKSGAFEAYLDANKHGVGSLNFHCTHYGASVYAGSNKDDANSWSITAVRCSYSLLTVLIEAKPQS